MYDAADQTNRAKLNDRAHLVSASVQIGRLLWSGHLGAKHNRFNDDGGVFRLPRFKRIVQAIRICRCYKKLTE